MGLNFRVLAGLASKCILALRGPIAAEAPYVPPDFSRVWRRAFWPEHELPIAIDGSPDFELAHHWARDAAIFA